MQGREVEQKKTASPMRGHCLEIVLREGREDRQICRTTANAAHRQDVGEHKKHLPL